MSNCMKELTAQLLACFKSDSAVPLDLPPPYSEGEGLSLHTQVAKMPPRFMERMARQSETLRNVFGEPPTSPPPYPASRSSRAYSEASSSSFSHANSPPPRYPRSRTHEGDLAVPEGSIILVTGASSWHGTHIINQLLKHGYRVRGTVRTITQASWTSKYFQDRYGVDRYHAVIVENMAARNAFDVVVRGCTGVIHVASVTTMSPDPNEVITPSIAGCINAAEAAAKESGVVRFVLCSAVAAAVSHDRGVPNDVTSESWNMLDFEDAWEPPPYEQKRANVVYASSKMQTEAALWRWYVRNTPSFVLNTVLPDTLVGPMLVPTQAEPTSTRLLKALQVGRSGSFPASHPVDIEDSALLHVAALMLPDVRGQRIFAAPRPCDVHTIEDTMKKLGSTLDVKADAAKASIDLTVFRETWKAEELLRRMGRKGWTDLEVSIKRACQEPDLDIINR